MFTQLQSGEILEHLERAQNPIFYYDNDADGLCSFILLRKFLGRGKGVAVRSFPDLNASYARKARELNADYVFILDKPVVSREFVDEILSIGLPIVWIDHHNVPQQEEFANMENVFIYNPARSGQKNSTIESEPVTYLVYSLTKRKEDMWLAMIGCIADHHLPDFSQNFRESYPEFWGKVKEPFDAYYNTEIGKIARALNFGLKDSVTNVVKLQNFLISCSSPGEVFSEGHGNMPFIKKYNEIRKKYDVLLEKARENVGDKLIFFSYSGETSMSSDISNELSYLYPKKYIVVAYMNGSVANISMRGKNVREILKKVLLEVEGSGGGHENAVGARVNTADLEKFKEVLEREI